MITFYLEPERMQSNQLNNHTCEEKAVEETSVLSYVMKCFNECF